MRTRVNQGGFTLIELVVVITILGILAAFAVPRFASLEVEARSAATQALSGSVRSASALAHALSLAQGNAAAATSTVVMEGTTINMVFGYPADGSIDDSLADLSGFTFAAGLFTKDGAATPANCSVDYAEPTAVGVPPTITLVTTGC